MVFEKRKRDRGLRVILGGQAGYKTDRLRRDEEGEGGDGKCLWGKDGRNLGTA